MDEKIFGCMFRTLQATDACMRSVETMQKALIKQAKINRKQRVLNFMLVVSLWNVLTRTGKITEILSLLNEKTKGLKEKLEGLKNEKGD